MTSHEEKSMNSQPEIIPPGRNSSLPEIRLPGKDSALPEIPREFPGRKAPDTASPPEKEEAPRL